MKVVKHRIMLVQMLFGDEFIIMVEQLDVHLFAWKQEGWFKPYLSSCISSLLSLTFVRLFTLVSFLNLCTEWHL